MADPLYTTGAQHRENRRNATGGGYVSGWVVAFTDNLTKVPGEVFVPDAQWPDGVAQAIKQQIAGIRHVATLTGSE